MSSNIYKNYIQANPDMSNADIVELMITDKADNGLMKKSIMRRLQYERRLMETSALGKFMDTDKWKISEPVEGVLLYEFQDRSGVTIIVSAEKVEEICSGYTKPSDMTAAQVAVAVEMSEGDVTNIIKSLGINKNSIPFAPHEIISSTDEELKMKLVARRRQKLERSIGGDIEIDVLKKALQEETKRRMELESYISFSERVMGAGMYELDEVVIESSKAKPYSCADVKHEVVRPGSTVVVMDPSAKDGARTVKLNDRVSYRAEEGRSLMRKEDGVTMHAVLSDWHIGKSTQRFNAKVAEERADSLVAQLSEHALANGVSNIIWHIDGDMVDGPAGNMHANQWMHQDVHFQDQIVLAAKLITGVITKVCAKTRISRDKVCMVGGNHGRFTAERSDDPVRMADALVYKMVEASLGIAPHNVISGEDFYLLNDNGLAVIGHHGDKMSKDPIAVIWELTQSGRAPIDTKAWVWLYGHLHSNVCEEIQTNCYSMRSGSFAGPDEYTLRIGKGARASQMAFVHRKHNASISPIWMMLD